MTAITRMQAWASHANKGQKCSTSYASRQVNRVALQGDAKGLFGACAGQTSGKEVDTMVATRLISDGNTTCSHAQVHESLAIFGTQERSSTRLQ